MQQVGYNKSMILSLKERAAASPVFSAMAHIFAMRERTRSQIVVTTLLNTMIGEGFKFSKAEYIKELEFLASQGIGKIDYDAKGRVRSLKGITVTLQSIGLAAVGNKPGLVKHKAAQKYKKLPIQMQSGFKDFKATLIIESNGLKQEFPISTSPEKVLSLLLSLGVSNGRV